MEKLFKDLEKPLALINNCINRDWEQYKKFPFVDPQKTSNVQKEDDGYHVQVLVPGFEKNELSINCQGSYLEVKGEKENKDTHGGLIKASIYQNILLGGNLDYDSVEATLKNGILYIIVPFKETKSKIIIK